MESVDRKYVASFVVFFIVLIAFFGLSTSAHAQIGTASAASLELNKKFPGPYEEVEVSLNAYTSDTTGATILWYVDGTLLVESNNARSFTLTTGDIGEDMVIRAEVRTPSSSAFSVQRILTPSEVDIIIEADTYTPTFYKGRAFPTSGALARIIAIPHIGENVSVTGLSYLWKLDTEVLFGGALRGESAIELTVPELRSPNLSVTVFDSAGNSVAGGSVRFPLDEIDIQFYAVNPLRGQTRKAVNERYILVEDEVSLRAEPYYMDKSIMDSKNTELVWRLNNRVVESVGSDPYTVTLRKTGGGGTARIDFGVANLSNILQNARGSFTIFFE